MMVPATFATRDYLRFISNLLDPDKCWEWQGQRTEDQYGKFSFRSVRLPAHRASYELFVGPIPEGLVIDHLCVNPSCVNPRHLDAVTPRENWARSRHHTVLNAAKTHCKHGHVFDEANTRPRVGKNGRMHRECRKCSAENAKRQRAKRQAREAEHEYRDMDGRPAPNQDVITEGIAW